MPTWVLIAAGFVVHAIVFISIFDIYFQTPILPGLPSHVSPLPPPAKRLVFIVADGLRADKTLMLQPDGSTPAPFLRSIAEKTGAWGISTAGVPTATRPGHVAMTVGFYEDPTSVTKDISGESILFDDIFQDTTYTWTWDTPQFLDKISDEHQGRIFSKKFPGDRKYLAGIDPRDMDSWVLKEVSIQEFLEFLSPSYRSHRLYREITRHAECRKITMNNVLVVAIIVAGIATLFDIIGTALPYWWVTLYTNTGLFEQCHVIKGSYGSKLCITYGNDALNWIKATQSMMILSILAYGSGTGLAAFFAFVMKKQHILAHGAVFMFFAGAGFAIIGVIIFAVKINEVIFEDRGVFHAGFGFAITAAILSVVSATLILISKGRNV